jgi:hypothetical protein
MPIDVNAASRQTTALEACALVDEGIQDLGCVFYRLSALPSISVQFHFIFLSVTKIQHLECKGVLCHNFMIL